MLHFSYVPLSAKFENFAKLIIPQLIAAIPSEHRLASSMFEDVALQWSRKPIWIRTNYTSSWSFSLVVVVGGGGGGKS